MIDDLKVQVVKHAVIVPQLHDTGSDEFPRAGRTADTVIGSSASDRVRNGMCSGGCSLSFSDRSVRCDDRMEEPHLIVNLLMKSRSWVAVEFADGRSTCILKIYLSEVCASVAPSTIKQCTQMRMHTTCVQVVCEIPHR